jgi:hypothetical protein
MPGKLGSVIPTVQIWTTKSGVWNARREAIVLYIDKTLEIYHRARPRSREIMEALSELYYALDFWLKEAGRGSSQVCTGRAAVVQELYVLVVGKLCETTGLTVNLLPRWLEETFGKGMTTHGYQKDHRDRNAKYLTAGEVQKYRLSFNKGVAYQEAWWIHSHALVLVDTVTNTQAAAAGKTMFPPQEGHQGYVLSMSRDFYMMQHITPKGEEKGTGQYHSSYFAGETVLCAGTLLITAGKVKTVTTASGHYAPGISHLSNAVATLAMLGVDMDGLVGWVYGEPAGRSAAEILRDRAIKEDAASTFEAQRTTGLAIMRTAEVDARQRAVATALKTKQEEGETVRIVAHFKVAGHSRHKCKICKELLSEGKFQKYWTLHSAA